MPSLLDISGLCMRFGGLTAVDRVDFSVHERQIAAIIGPNGAGKTTIFNAVTGIYEPTEGEITFLGQSMRRPLTTRVIVACALVGVLTALAAMFIVAGPDGLFRAAIKRNARRPDGTPFRYADALADGWKYLRGEPAVVARGKSWLVVSPTNETLARAKTQEEATAKREGILAEIRDGRRESESRLGAMGLAGIVGLAMGAGGALAVWQRSRRTTDVIALRGIARTFQNIRLFGEMTALENVMVAMDRTMRGGLWRMMLRTPAIRRQDRMAARRAKRLLKFVGLEGADGRLARNLPYGSQRRLEIARALATEPKLLLLDEPAAGMNPTESESLIHLIRRIRDRGVTVLLIEHHMKLVMDISDRIAVLDFGKKIAEGTPAEVRNNPQVIEAYLGKEEVG